MKKKFLVFISILYFCLGVASAQNTVVSSTGVVDSDSTTWANGRWAVSFVPGPYNPNPSNYTVNGSPLSSSVITQNGSLDAGGAFSVTIYNGSNIAPSGSSWNLTVCPNASVACTIYNFKTSTSTLDITSALNAFIPPPRFIPVSGSYGYADVEAELSLVVGSTYYNVTSACIKVYSGSTWACVTGGGGGSITGVTAGTGLNGGGTSGTVTVNLNTALPNGQTATTQTNGDNTTKVATDQFVLNNLNLTLPGTPQFIYRAFSSSGTTLVDSSGNGFNGTFAAGAKAPTFNAAGNGIVFAQHGVAAPGQNISIPVGALNGIKSFIIFFQPNYPPDDDPGETQEVFLFSDCAGHGVGMFPARFGMIGLFNNAAETTIATDRMIGNSALAYDVPASGTATGYVNGHAVQGYLEHGTTTNFFNCSSGPGNIGTYTPGGAQYGFSGTLYSFIGWNVDLTGAQLQQAYNAEVTLLQQNGVSSFQDVKAPYLMMYQGDSRTIYFTPSNLTPSRPWQISLLQPERSQFYNMGISGETLGSINGNIPNVETPILRNNGTTNSTILIDAITNDILGSACTTAALCYTTIQTYCSTVHNIKPGTRITYATSLPRSSWGSPASMEAIRSGTMGLVISGEQAGTFNCDGIDDIATDPLAATQVLPNAFITSPAATIAITGCTGSGTVATCTLASAPPAYQCFNGASFVIAGMTPSTYNVTSTVNSTCSGSTITYTNSTTAASTVNGTAQYTFNTGYYFDGTHENATLIAEMAPRESAGILYAQNRLSTCTYISMQVPYLVMDVANTTTPGLTQSIPLLQLQPGEQVCSAKLSVTGVYAGSGIGTLTASIGDSTGTATQYLAAQSLLATGTTETDFQTFQSVNGVVQLNITAVGGNINTLTSGTATVWIGVKRD